MDCVKDSVLLDPGLVSVSPLSHRLNQMLRKKFGKQKPETKDAWLFVFRTDEKREHAYCKRKRRSEAEKINILVFHRLQIESRRSISIHNRQAIPAREKDEGRRQKGSVNRKIPNGKPKKKKKKEEKESIKNKISHEAPTKTINGKSKAKQVQFVGWILKL